MPSVSDIGSPDVPRPEPRMRQRQQFYISAYWFGTNLLWMALLLIIMPSQMRRLFPSDPSRMLGLIIGFGSLPAILVPLLVGPISDRCMSRWGRRRPFMFVGVSINLVGLALLWFAGEHLLLWLYIVGYFVSNTGNNIATGAYSAIIPDLVPEPQRGQAGGWMAAMTQLGQIAGAVSAGLLMHAGQVLAAYGVIAGTLVVFLIITAAGIREQPRTDSPGPLDLIAFLKRLWIDPRKHPNFAWVWITRLLVMMGVYSVQEFIQYYLVDEAKVPIDRAELAAGQMFVILLVAATPTALLGGGVSDRIGRRPVIYTANTLIAAACLAFILSPSLMYAYIVAVAFGLGFGAYCSVDWALGVDVLPNKEQDAAKDMAVWHIALTLPQVIAVPIGGVLLGAFGKTTIMVGGLPQVHYDHGGYVALFLIAGAYFILGAVLLRNVRGVR
jgi:MFS family permease